MKKLILTISAIGAAHMLIANNRIDFHTLSTVSHGPIKSSVLIDDRDTFETKKKRHHDLWEASLKHKRAEKLLAAMMFGECRSKGDVCMRAVGHVAMNRAALNLDKRYGRGLWGVLKKRKAFSCFLKNDPNSKVIKKAMTGGLKPNSAEGKSWALAQTIAHDLMHRKTKDITKGAVYYHAPYVIPKWIKDTGMVKVARLAGHIFYKKVG